MDFWIGQPLESGNISPNSAPAFWPCAAKSSAYLLDLAGHPHGNGICPHSLKEATIPTLTTEIIKGKSNFPQLATRGNYIAGAPTTWLKSMPETAHIINNFTCLFWPNPRSAQGRYRSLLKSTHLSFWGTHVQAISMLSSQNPMGLRLTLGRPNFSGGGEFPIFGKGGGKNFVCLRQKIFRRRTSNGVAGGVNFKRRIWKKDK